MVSMDLEKAKVRGAKAVGALRSWKERLLSGKAKMCMFEGAVVPVL